MKLVVPRTCQVGALGYVICYNDRLLEKMDLAAHISSRDQKIILSHRQPDQEFHGLVHEAIHGVAAENGLEFRDSEQVIATLSVGIVNFLVSLGIEADFSEIQEEQ